jgi:predicted DsbA family dithiol-disulfide isomerase
MRKADIEVFSDFTCPWCYITTRRMHTAIQQLPADVRVEVFWRPFALDAEASRNVLGYADVRGFLTAIGAAEGIEFAFDRIARVPDTRDAHRLVWLAARDGQRRGVVADLVERSYRAHFSEGRDIGNRTTLAEIAGEAGLDAARTAAQLVSQDGVLEVQALRRRAEDLGIETVPFLLINNAVGVRGSRSIASLREKIEGGSWFGVDRRRHGSVSGADRQASNNERPGISAIQERDIDQILADSFPASDAPPWTLGVPGRRRRRALEDGWPG